MPRRRTPDRSPAAPSPAGSKKTTRARPARMSSGLVALSSAAVLSVYAAGFARTKASADRIADASARRSMPGEAEFGRGRAASMGPAPAASLSPQPATAPVTEDPSKSASAPAVAAPAAPPVAVESASPAERQGGAPGEARAAAGQTSAVPKTTANATMPALAGVPADAAPAVDVPAGTSDSHETGGTTSTTSAAPVAAAAAIEAPAASAPKPQAPALKDGTYTGWGTCRHGDIQAEVVIAGGRIASARISQCWTRYTCNWLDPIVPQVVQRQSPAVDYVSGATQSTDAFYYAVLDALLKAK